MYLSIDYLGLELKHPVEPGGLFCARPLHPGARHQLHATVSLAACPGSAGRIELCQGTGVGMAVGAADLG